MSTGISLVALLNITVSDHVCAFLLLFLFLLFFLFYFSFSFFERMGA